MRTRLFIVRHGESTDNAIRCFSGRRDVPLTAAGEAQARALARRLKPEGVDVVLSSPLHRAEATAHLIAETWGREVEPAPQWEEANFGQWEGLTYEQARRKHPRAAQRWVQFPLTASPPNGESFREVYERVSHAWDHLLEVHRGRRILLVTHGGPIRALCVKILQAPLWAALHLSVDLAGLTIVDDYDGELVMVSLNERVTGKA